ncbi:MAG: hypothetical protein NPIRA04_21920 [Nitrospirales bacterium]|nr:MAG: hypothetical protein NPIRA04_21920 [Nitrospirales bacterium]
MRIKQLLSESLPLPLRQWLWERKVAGGNRRIQELGRQLSTRIHDAAQKDMAIGKGIQTKADWESFRDVRCEALRHSLNLSEKRVAPPRALVTGTLNHHACHIENMVFQGYMDIPVTANMYRPVGIISSTPAIVLCHSHHNSKSEEELQCMGMTWASQGYTVLLMDLLGHGERRQHPFAGQKDFAGAFRVDRQDYYFRSVLNLQLQLVGESLMGWMVQDVRRGIDLLCADPHIDSDRIIVVGAVAGGGDLAAVVGAIDMRVTTVVTFNFGHLSMGDWESTRNLPDTARLRFWPWVILASLAPRRLIYGREFAWNHGDGAWSYLEKVYALYGQSEALRSVSGSGHVSSNSPLDSHCINIGPLHRAQLYPIFQDWFGIPVPEHEETACIEKDKLICMTEEAQREFNPRRVHEVALQLSRQYLTVARAVRAAQEPALSALQLQQDLVRVLGPMQSFTSYRVHSMYPGVSRSEYVKLEVEKNILVRLQILRPSHTDAPQSPVVIGVAQEGNRRLKKRRQLLIRQLLKQGMVVCLTELRGIGDGRHGEIYRGRISPSAGIAATSLMLGESLLVSRLRDLRTVIAYLTHRDEIDANRVGIWGDALAVSNFSDDDLAVPFDADSYPERGEPLGGVVSLLAALFEPQIQAVYIQGGLASYETLLNTSYVYQPGDSLIRGLLTVADIPDLAAALAPRALRMEGLVDGSNRQLDTQQIEAMYHRVRSAYGRTDERESHCSINIEKTSSLEISRWFAALLCS